MNKMWFYRLFGIVIVLALLLAAGQALWGTFTNVQASSGAQTVTLQHGVNGYTGTQDVGLIAWNPHTNYDGGINDQMEIRSTGQLAGLLQFDLTSIPADADHPLGHLERLCALSLWPPPDHRWRL